MDYDKAYKESLERARIKYADNNYAFAHKVLEEIFPELKESEDEKIRKDIVFYIAANHKDDGEKARWFNWLEKQKPVEWSEEDCNKCDRYCQILKMLASNARLAGLKENAYNIEEMIEWLKSLKEQGLKYNQETQSIEEIKGNDGGISPKFRIEAGKWYVCTKSLFSAPETPMFIRGCLYHSPKDDYLVRDDNSSPEIIGAFFIGSFRPATEEEIESNNQLTHSEPTKKSDQDELTEFEVEFLRIYHHSKPSDFTDDRLARYRKGIAEILELARKQIAGEIDVDAMVNEYTKHLNSKGVNTFDGFAASVYRQGIERCKLAIREGGK